MSDSTQQTIKDSAEATQAAAQTSAGAAVKTKDSADRRTELAADRTVFAAERTYAAWVRTGLVALASGVGARKLLDGVVPGWMIVGMGTVLVLFSAFCFIAGVWRQAFTEPREPDVRRLPPIILVLINGFLALVAVAALIGLWLGKAG